MSVISANDLIASVEKINNLASTEADWRSVCSRAYYSIYEDGRVFHASLKVPGSVKADSKGGKHQDLYEQLKNPRIAKTDPDFAKSMTIGALMESLHAKRIKSDYFRDQRIGRQDAKDSVAQCNKVLSRLHASPPVAPPPTAPVAPSGSSSTGRPTLTRIK